MGYGDYKIGNVTISRVYFVEGLGHNLFSIGQFCDSDLEVAFRQHTCFILNLEGVDLLTGSRGNNLYTLSLGDMMESSPICLLSKASKTKSWLWHRCLSHLNFGAINYLARQGLVRGLPKLKFKRTIFVLHVQWAKDTPMVEKSKLDEDKERKVVDPSHYRGMIGTLLYLTDSRPDLQFAICMYARSDITSKESTRQVVYDVLRLTSFYKAFLVTVDVPEIYMQEFWATTTIHHHSIRFKMNNKKRIVNLEYFGEMLHICPRFPNQTFNELLFKEEILAFLRYLGHSGEIKKITDVKINKLHQPWISFVAVINKCLSRKSTGSTVSAYKEYYAIASGAAPPKTKKQPAKSSKAKGLSVLSEVTLNEAKQIKLATKRSLQQTHISQASGSGVDEGTSIIPRVLDVSSDEEISWKSSDEDDDDDDVNDPSNADNNDDDQDSENDGDDFVHTKLSTYDEEAKDEESFDPIVKTPSQVENSNDESNDDKSHGINVRGEEGPDVEDDDEELYIDVNINLEGIDSLFKSTHRVDTPVSTAVLPLLVTAPTLPPPSIIIMSQFAKAVSSILGIIDGYIDHRMNETVKVAFQLQSDKLQDEAQAENEYFINKLDENIQKIIKEQVKEQVKIEVSKILPKIKKTINEQLEAEVLTRSSNSSKTSYVVAADLSELELKKIIIEKMESNKSIHRSDEQRNLYKALVDAYKCDKIILDTYGDTVTLKIRRDDVDKDEEPSTGSDQGSKRRREGKEPESISARKEKDSKTTGKSTEGSKSYQKTGSKYALAEEPMQATQDLKEPLHQEFKTGAAHDQPIAKASQHPECDLAKQADSYALFNELMDTPVDFLAFMMNRLNVDTLTPKLLAHPTYELMKGSCKSLVELKFFLEEVYKATTDQLDRSNPEG
nr:retrovirus-related Pol polyprotein from transposon TNT 1-94 [Tanacetum cinerariifolium]